MMSYKEILYKLSHDSISIVNCSHHLLLLGRLHLDIELGDLPQVPSARKLHVLLGRLSLQSVSETQFVQTRKQNTLFESTQLVYTTQCLCEVPTRFNVSQRLSQWICVVKYHMKLG